LASFFIFQKYPKKVQYDRNLEAASPCNRVGKIYFIGAAGGGVEPFLGFGQFNAVLTGIMAARSIASGADINLLLSDLKKKSNELLTLRPLLNAATNEDLDKLLTFMKTPGLRTMIYRTRFDIIKLLSSGLKLVESRKNVQQQQTGGRKGR
jgi:digeranylgeranylglycerophospholipid reductase